MSADIRRQNAPARRRIYLFSAVEAIVFTAVGWLFGRECAARCGTAMAGRPSIRRWPAGLGSCHVGGPVEPDVERARSARRSAYVALRCSGAPLPVLVTPED
ncbi:hypothetical protein Vau01_104870 [Virgisporangium aurantiacum]|uniref:Uncharacterized protein n=1 Tax=Virgisporangium aurantiacum TaxID=175570 RepID=A0A8J3ZFK5_9ACTN|nr:hypothetical protein Vau01_104870 [Virgisporangium aurantiacum]